MKIHSHVATIIASLFWVNMTVVTIMEQIFFSRHAHELGERAAQIVFPIKVLGSVRFQQSNLVGYCYVSSLKLVYSKQPIIGLTHEFC